MRRADRLFQIVQYLRGGRLVTAENLAGRLEVSKRTIYRDVADLIGSGVPIEGEAGVGYVMRAGYDVPPLMFTTDEIVALVAGARMIGAWGGADMAASAEEALVKIRAVLPDDARARAERVEVYSLGMERITDEVRARLDRLERAARERVRLWLRYADERGAPSERHIRPLGLYFWGTVWTLVSWCELRQGFRMFRVDRIAEMTEAGRFKEERNKTLKAFFSDPANRRPGG